MEKKAKKIAKRYLIILVVSYILMCIISTVYVTWQQFINDYNPVTMLSGMQIIMLLVVILYFIPLTWRCCHYTKAANMDKTYKVLRISLAAFIIWSALLGLFTIAALINPAFFT